ncbi:MAG TPA: hypothetical protein VIN08_13085 [Ohtaekwangia sp.]|uniref:hypothetical protein n=1 Tax=Ohtaekwangia sp. TaxID=2066019 RepID=UPI002F93D9BD
MKGLIRLCYTKIIDAASTGVWEKYVFEDTYREFFMQAQFYNQQQQYTTFREILESNPKADQLHYLVSTAAMGYLRQLNGRIPDVANVSGKLCLPFRNFKFEILHSHVKEKDQHKVAIHFYSEVLTWIDMVNGLILFAEGDQRDAYSRNVMMETDMLSLRNNLRISAFQPFVQPSLQRLEIPGSIPHAIEETV